MLRKLGLLIAWFAILAVELAVAFTVLFLVQHYLFAGFDALGWASGNEVAFVASLLLAVVLGFIPAFLIDALAKRWTGLTPLSDIGHFFPFI